ncbi:MAG TPA: nuclear transport factor 2 family protein [Vicinamibacterales bacterium]|nr:nuclear transport factor 2 family protein [Vicinamibacterales bacterium]
MAKTLVIAVLGVGVVLASQLRNVSTAAASKPTLTVQDYIDIYNLYGIYTRYFDMGADDGTRYASTFTPDGEFGQSGTRVGREAQKAAFMSSDNMLKRDGRSRRHTTTNIVVSPSPEGARGSAYLLIYNITAVPPFVEGGGLYDDWLAKTSDGWKFKKRAYYTFPTFKPGMPQGMDFLFPKVPK